MTEASSFISIVVFCLGGAAFAMAMLGVARLFAPRRPYAAKLKPYECGEDLVETPGAMFHARYYIVALVFLLFEAELLFLFPLALLMKNDPSGLAVWVFWETLVFIVILSMGLVWAWARGYLDWVKPEAKPVAYQGPVSEQQYLSLNTQWTQKQS